MRSKLMCTAAVTAVILTGGVLVPANAEEPGSDALAAIQAAAPEVLEGVADAPGDGSGEVAIDLEADSTAVSVTVPVDPADGITLDSGAAGGGVVGLGLPNAESAATATKEGNGVVSYDNGDGSTTVPVVKEDGSVQVATTIDGPDAPTRYDYPLTLPDGATAELDPETGAVSFIGTDGAWLGGVAPAWANDADGTAIPTRYELAGTTLTQIVDHGTGVDYPVVADPWLGFALIEKAVWARNLWQYSPTLKVYPTWWGRYGPIGARWAAWSETLSKTPRSGWPNPNTASMSGQFYCHYDIVRLRAPNKEYWGLDSKLPNRGYAGFVANSCN
ncbi:DUF2599 domain-containing protein [Microbacterium sp. NPDC057407]|uniref:DUF2599 domain-containing protein n=1 Tax=Microbacterium sp. NPDC057407 TaxID=3346120 RepID=UPI003671F6D4